VHAADSTAATKRPSCSVFRLIRRAHTDKSPTDAD
jgi:hypothetical protein